MYPEEDPTLRVTEIVQRLFEDLDVNEDGNLVSSFTEYSLNDI